MASIREKRQNNKTVSYEFACYLGRDVTGKQIRRYGTWTPEEGLTSAKARKAAERAADEWEKKVKEEYEKDLNSPERAEIKELSRSAIDFPSFVLDVWFPLAIENGGYKPKTVSFYNDTVKNIAEYFSGCAIQKISSITIQKFLI